MWTFIAFVTVMCFTMNWYRRRKRITRVEDCHVFITGCDTGFGHALAKRLDTEGVTVFAGCFTETGREKLRKCSSNRVTVLELDITKQDSIYKAYDEIESRLPDGKGLWGLVNNAGVTGMGAPLEWYTIEDFKSCCEVNLYGMIAVTKKFLPLVRTARGRIVNITSVAGRMASPYYGPYAVSKYGAEAFSDVLRRECYDQGVSVHILEPGYFNTEMVMNFKIKDEAETKFQAAEDNVKLYYGEDFVKELADKFNADVAQFTSIKINKVVDAYVHALTSQYPKVRYLVGLDAKLIFRLLWNIPEFISDAILTSKMPKPKGANLRIANQ